MSAMRDSEMSLLKVKGVLGSRLYFLSKLELSKNYELRAWRSWSILISPSKCSPTKLSYSPGLSWWGRKAAHPWQRWASRLRIREKSSLSKCAFSTREFLKQSTAKVWFNRVGRCLSCTLFSPSSLRIRKYGKSNQNTFSFLSEWTRFFSFSSFYFFR